MARKAKKNLHKMPKLSALDQFIYWFVFVLLACLWLGVILLHLWHRERISFADELVVAVEARASYLWVMIPWMTFFLITFILWTIPYQERKPIFGLRNFKYGPPAWPKVYPLFMKNKPYVWVSEKSKRSRKWTALILIIVFLVSMIPYPWSLYGRECLLSDGSVQQYNMFNGKIREFSCGQIDAVEYEIYRHGTGKSSIRKVWDVRMHLTTDTGKTYTFEYRDFRYAYEGDPRGWLSAMLEVKARYIPEIITCTGTENLDALLSGRSFTQTEREALYQLFNLS